MVRNNARIKNRADKKRTSELADELNVIFNTDKDVTAYARIWNSKETT